MSDIFIFIIIFAISLIGVWMIADNYLSIKKMEEGTDRMKKIAEAIRIGANAFLSYEAKVISVVVAIVAALWGVLISWEAAVCFLIGAIVSFLAGYIGMKAATYANVRVTNTARETNNIGKTLKIAFKGGSVMGLSVSAFSLIGLSIIFLVFGKLLGQMNYIYGENVTNWLGLSFNPFGMSLSCYALGCSVIAMFNRIGGGIYTKAADMGADLVGKTEMSLEEDDPRNPATIADNVGDNVGDVCGLGSDLLESYMGSVTSSIILMIYMFANNTGMISILALEKLIFYPILFAGFGLLACIIGVLYLLNKQVDDDPHKHLNLATWLAAGLAIIFGFVVSYIYLNGVDFSGMAFKFGKFSPWIAATLGVISGIAIGSITEYYTSAKYNPTKDIAVASDEGPALTITSGLAVGMISCLYPCIVLGLTIMLSYWAAGLYGVAIAAMGMLSFVSLTVSVDTYGPISDNAGGIAEMSHLDPGVREITDELDAVGNTTAAIGKGFAIGSATFAALSLMVSYLYSFLPAGEELILNIISPITLAGVVIGGALPFLFSGILINSVVKAARKMVIEVRRQFKEIKGLTTGEADPDYKTCIEISTKGALEEMKVPALLAILFPIITGFIFGPYFVAGALIGSTISAIMLALFCGNSGGAWDNAKKYIETDLDKKGTDMHKASVVGDTVGDPLKDTVGPSLDILIKIMSTVSLVAVPIFAQFNLINLL